MIRRKWAERGYDPYLVEKIASELTISPLLAKVLVGRGFASSDSIFKFLNPSLKHLPDPFLFKDMKKAVARIHKAIVNNELIAIYGDYDVDGVTSTSIIYLFLKEIGVRNIIYHLPSRVDDTYGISTEIINKLHKEGVKLLITVDCGSSNYEEVKKAKEVGMDVIITDHHQVSEDIPPALAFINPHKSNCSFPDKSLAGVGVAFYLIIALRSYLRQKNFFGKNNKGPNLKKYLDIVSIGTIADIVPLIGANRIFTKIGLELLSKSSHIRPGLRALMEIAGFAPPVTPYTIGFIIAPRLNASARLGDTYLPFKLLISDDYDEAIKIARELERRNRERQELERLTEKQALEKIDIEKKKSVVLYDPGWHPGIIGLVAAKLTEKLGKPTFILGKKGNGIPVGSGRSLPGIHLYKVLSEIKDLFLSYGGHSMAAGLTISEDKIPELVERFEETVSRILGSEIEITEEYDGDLNFSQLSYNDVKSLELLQPFGEGNPEPLFKTSTIIIKRFLTSNGSHLKLYLKDSNGIEMPAIAFRWTGENPPENSDREIIYTPKINTYNHSSYVELHIRDIF